VPLFVAYYRRALPKFLRIKRLVDDGAIGTVRFVQMTLFQRPNPLELDRDALPWRVIPEIAGGGRFLDLASHALDVLDFVLGPVAEAAGRAANQGGLYDAEDVVAGTWVHASGVVGAGVWCFTAHDRVDRCEVVGSKGTLTFDILEGGPDAPVDGRRAAVVRRPEPGAHPAALDPDGGGRTAGQGRVPEHRGVGRPDELGDGSTSGGRTAPRNVDPQG
jgi:predicted dehydrogenase